MDELYSARLGVYCAIISRWPPGPERERWLKWLYQLNGKGLPAAKLLVMDPGRLEVGAAVSTPRP
jgi:hypothetical protein